MPTVRELCKTLANALNAPAEQYALALGFALDEDANSVHGIWVVTQSACSRDPSAGAHRAHCLVTLPDNPLIKLAAFVEAYRATQGYHSACLDQCAGISMEPLLIRPLR
jgi:hypothetical protein